MIAGTEATGSPSNARNANKNAATMMFIQRGQQEKALMLMEIQSLKQQLRTTSSLLDDSVAGEKKASSAGLDTWNKLLESNLRTGTSSCCFALKWLFQRKMSDTFRKWHLNAKLSSAYLQIKTQLTQQQQQQSQQAEGTGPGLGPYQQMFMRRKSSDGSGGQEPPSLISLSLGPPLQSVAGTSPISRERVFSRHAGAAAYTTDSRRGGGGGGGSELDNIGALGGLLDISFGSESLAPIHSHSQSQSQSRSRSPTNRSNAQPQPSLPSYLAPTYASSRMQWDSSVPPDDPHPHHRSAQYDEDEEKGFAAAGSGLGSSPQKLCLSPWVLPQSQSPSRGFSARQQQQQQQRHSQTSPGGGPIPISSEAGFLLATASSRKKAASTKQPALASAVTSERKVGTGAGAGTGT